MLNSFKEIAKKSRPGRLKPERTTWRALVENLKPAVTVDFDDIIAYFFRGFLPWCAHENGTTLQYEDMHDYGNHCLLHSDADLVREWINYYSEHHQSDCKPVEGVVENLGKLGGYFQLHLVTSRPVCLELVVRSWLQDHDILHLFASLNFTNSFGNDPDAPRTDKPTVCRNLKAIAHIDDAVNHVIAVGEIGVPVYMLERPWNRGKIPTAAILAHNWDEITKLLLAKID